MILKMPSASSAKKSRAAIASKAAHTFCPPPKRETAAASSSAAVSVYMEEDHPTGPFVHADSRVLVCGTFPPVKKSIKFYYPNSNNDMWRILGNVFFQDANHFYTDIKTVKPGKRRRQGSTRVVHCLKETEIRSFVQSNPVGFFDMCKRVRRRRNNSSDDNIETLERTDVLQNVLAHTPHCEAIITTGTLALTMLLDTLSGCGSFTSPSGDTVEAVARSRLGRTRYNIPCIGGKLLWKPDSGVPYQSPLWIYRAPSTSRALPIRLEQKTAYYGAIFRDFLNLS